MSISVSGSQITFNDASTQNTAATGFGFKNRIINGNMIIDQRNAGAAKTVSVTTQTYTLDRWQVYSIGNSCTIQQTSSGVTGIPNIAQITGNTSISAINFYQAIESKNIADLAGSTVILSLSLANSLLTSVTWTANYANSADNFSATTQIATGTFTVNSTLSTYSAQITLPANAANGVQIIIGVGAQTSGTWKIGQVQLEKGSTATSFDYRPYGTELVLAQRYCFVYKPGGNYMPYFMAHGVNTTGMRGLLKFPQTMRSAPTFTFSAANTFQWSFGNVATSIALAENGTDMCSIDVGSTGTAANAGYMITSANTANSYIIGSAEL